MSITFLTNIANWRQLELVTLLQMAKESQKAVPLDLYLYFENVTIGDLSQYQIF